VQVTLLADLDAVAIYLFSSGP